MTPEVVYVRPPDGPALDAPDLTVHVAEPGHVLDTVRRHDPDCVVCEGSLSGDLDVIERVREGYPHVPVVLVTDAPDGAVAARATRHGIAEYVPRETVEESVAERVWAVLADGDDRRGVAMRRRFEALFDHPATPTVILNPDGAIRRANDAALELFDSTHVEVVGAPFHVSPWWTDETAGRVATAIDRAATGEHADFEAVHSTPDRREVVIDATVAPVTDAHGEVTSLIVVGRDVTERQRREEMLATLLETARDLMDASGATEVCERAMETASGTFGLPMTAVFLRQNDAMVPVAWSEASVEVLGDVPTIPRGQGFAWEVFDDGESRLYYPHEETGAYNPDTPVETELIVPVGDHGVIITGSTERVEFDEFDRDFVELLAATTKAALDRTSRRKRLLRYERLLENVGEMVYALTPDGEFDFLTPGFARLLGYDRESLLGEPVTRIVHDDDVEDLLATLDCLGTNGADDTVAFETRFVTTDGEVVPVEMELSWIQDEDVGWGGVGVVHDITDLTDERNRFRYLFEAVPEPVVEVECTDDGPVIRSANATFTETFGFDRGDVEGKSVEAFLVSPNDERPVELDCWATGGASFRAEVRRRTESGMRDFLLRAVPYDDGRRGFGIYTDITERKERERYLEVLNRVLRHNLRNDLTAISAFTGHLRREVEDDYLQGLAERVDQIVDDLTDLSSNAREIERAMRTDPSEVGTVDIADAAESVVAEHRDHGTTIESEVPDGPTEVAGDARLRTAVDHLIENAIEHAGETPRIRVSVDDTSNDRVKVTVTDDGPGIPDIERRILTGETAITQLQHGSGLGLWLVKWTVRSCGGDVGFETPSEGGSRVTLYLERA